MVKVFKFCCGHLSRVTLQKKKPTVNISSTSIFQKFALGVNFCGSIHVHVYI